MTLPSMTRLGNVYSFRYDEDGIEIEVARLRDKWGTVEAEMTAADTSAAARRNIRTSTVSLLTARSRAEFTNAIAKRSNGFKFDWETAVEYCALTTVKDWRRGSPLVNLADVPFQARVQMLVDRLLPEGETTIVFGDGEAGKSTFARIVAVAGSAGMALPRGLRPVRPLRVLYCDWESDDAAYHARELFRIRRGLGLEDRRVDIFYKACYRSISDDAAELALLREQGSFDLVIIDSLTNGAGGPLIKDEVAASTMGALRTIGGTRLAIGHVNRVDREQLTARQSVFGSVVWRNLARAMWQLVPEGDFSNPDVRSFALYQRKANKARADLWPIGLQLIYDDGSSADDPGAIRLLAQDVAPESQLAAGASQSERVVRLLRLGALTNVAIAESLNMDTDATRPLLNRLVKQGRLVKLEEGGGRGRPTLYGLPARGEDPTPQRELPEDRCWCGAPPWSTDSQGRFVCEEHAEKP